MADFDLLKQLQNRGFTITGPQAVLEQSEFEEAFDGEMCEVCAFAEGGEKMNKIPEGWDACSAEEAEYAWTPWEPCADICRSCLNTWVCTRRLCYIYLEDWDDIGIIPIRKVKPEPFDTVVTATKSYDAGWDYLHITAQVHRPGKYRVIEVVE